MAPLALFSIGLQMKFNGWRQQFRHITVSLLYKLVLAPLLIYGVALIFGMRGIIPQISVFEAAMPSFLTAGIVASEYNLNPTLSSLVVGVSILVAFFTTALWYFIIVTLA